VCFREAVAGIGDPGFPVSGIFSTNEREFDGIENRNSRNENALSRVRDVVNIDRGLERADVAGGCGGNAINRSK
jgi:hypothetical protein